MGLKETAGSTGAQCSLGLIGVKKWLTKNIGAYWVSSKNNSQGLPGIIVDHNLYSPGLRTGTGNMYKICILPLVLCACFELGSRLRLYF